MKKFSLALILAASPFMTHAVTHSCGEQVADLKAKIAAANRAGNSADVSRLNYALTKVKTYCTDERQASRATQDVSKRQQKVKQAGLELQEAQQALEEAKADGRTDKVAKKSYKVDEKKRKLQAAQSELKQAQEAAERLK